MTYMNMSAHSPHFVVCPTTGAPLNCTISTLTIPTGLKDWDLVNDFLKLRKQVFVDQKAWGLFHESDLEFEQYDVGPTHYLIAHRDRVVLGGGRLRNTADRTGCYRYMIHDAWAGLLEGMPQDLCDEEPPTDPRIWEFTRYAVVPGEPGLSEAILHVLNYYLDSLGVKTCLFLSSPALMRYAKRLGFEPRPLGKVVGNKDGRFLAFSCDVRHEKSSAFGGLL